jgi:hypothetical protein
LTVVAIHQPNYLPWAGYFAKALAADVLILLDTVQFTKESYINRVRAKGPNGPFWLTQPVQTAGKLHQRISEVHFARSDWSAKHMKALELAYARAPFYRHYAPGLADRLNAASEHLVTRNTALLVWAAAELGLSTRLVLASSLGVNEDDPTTRLIALTRAVAGDTYLSGQGGFKYQDVDAFEAAGVAVRRAPRPATAYPQLWGAFEPGLSIVDLLFNCGPESRELLRSPGERA